MNIKERLTISRVLIFLFVTISAFLPLILFFTIEDIIFNLSSFLTFICFPLIMLTVLGLIIFSKKKKWLRFLLGLLTVVIGTALFFELFFFTHFEILHHHQNEEIPSLYGQGETVYEKRTMQEMPNLSEIGSPANKEYYHYFSSFGGFFTCDADILICRYHSDDYEKQKQTINETYMFQKDHIRLMDGKQTEPISEIDGYLFRLLSIEENGFLYPSQMVLIAQNDETKEIVYLSFYDDDLDHISSLEDFIGNDCRWKYIR